MLDEPKSPRATYAFFWEDMVSRTMANTPTIPIASMDYPRGWEGLEVVTSPRVSLPVKAEAIAIQASEANLQNESDLESELLASILESESMASSLDELERSVSMFNGEAVIAAALPAKVNAAIPVDGAKVKKESKPRMRKATKNPKKAVKKQRKAKATTKKTCTSPVTPILKPSPVLSSTTLSSLDLQAIALQDLTPANAGVVRHMNPEERALVLLKRKIRNRQSARRSRQKRLEAVADLLATVTALRQESDKLKQDCKMVADENLRLKEELYRLNHDA
eukprot:CAMPEP_0184697490 /NCGR_PEP_ID=MMETSP0313-20130426/4443_1 /TAXON_ID=2792 /ORGANISM="Porphyridium aerugineum, Strain SAG 1380-2" /LENGTH=278 /DNA_ID=CAMNT_0027156297 /DNA_START=307 /DNA_END=1143 /DNA_ORIENTATION=+